MSQTVVERFQIHAPDGRVYDVERVLTSPDILDRMGRPGRTQTVPGVYTYRTTCGLDVQRTDQDGLYVIHGQDCLTRFVRSGETT